MTTEIEFVTAAAFAAGLKSWQDVVNAWQRCTAFWMAIETGESRYIEWRCWVEKGCSLFFVPDSEGNPRLDREAILCVHAEESERLVYQPIADRQSYPVKLMMFS